MKKELMELIGNTIRGLSLDAVNKARSGHIGLPLGCSELIANLFANVLKHSPKNPDWINRDRFVLSAGHGSMLLYSILHLSGYDISIDDIKNFRQLHAKTPGHPEFGITPGVEVTTGPLGQGVSNAVGMAIAERMLAERFNTDKHKIIDHYTFCLAGDGCLMEGVSAEAVSLAGHFGLGKLILIYDNNKITIDGTTEISFTENVKKRFEAYNWDIHNINVEEYDKFIEVIGECKNIIDKPSIIVVDTIPGKGLAKYEGSYKSHGCPMNNEDVEEARKKFNFPSPFYIPEEVKKFFKEKQPEFKSYYDKWANLYNDWKKENTSLAKEFEDSIKGKFDLLNTNILSSEILSKSIATREASGEVINAISDKINCLVGGSADLAGSTNTTIKNSSFIAKGDFKGKNIHFGVREHGMAGILNGMALHKGLRPYGSTFLVFSDYMRPSIRLSALMKLPVIYIFTHDSFQVGEDGPTHQPIEQIQSLRNIPNLVVIRPADTYEVEEAWKYALNSDNPVALILTRQKVNNIDRQKYASAKGLHNGAYILKDSQNGNPDIILIATGSEVALSLDISNILEEKYKKQVRVISIPSQEIFDSQPNSYKEKILPNNIRKRISIEFGVTNGWGKYIGLDGLAIGLNRFGDSAPASELLNYFGFTTEKVVEKIAIYYMLK